MNQKYFNFCCSTQCINWLGDMFNFQKSRYQHQDDWCQPSQLCNCWMIVTHTGWWLVYKIVTYEYVEAITWVTIYFYLQLPCITLRIWFFNSSRNRIFNFMLMHLGSSIEAIAINLLRNIFSSIKFYLIKHFWKLF